MNIYIGKNEAGYMELLITVWHSPKPKEVMRILQRKPIKNYFAGLVRYNLQKMKRAKNSTMTDTSSWVRILNDYQIGYNAEEQTAQVMLPDAEAGLRVEDYTEVERIK